MWLKSPDANTWLYHENGMEDAAYEWEQKTIDFCRDRLVSNVNPEGAMKYYGFMERIYLKRGDYEQLAEIYTEEIDWAKQKAKKKYYGTGHCYVKRANCYEKLGWMEAAQQDYESAVECFTKSIAISEDKNPGSAYYVRGSVYEKLGRFHEAKQDYKKAFEMCSYVDEKLKAAVRRSEDW